MILYEYPFNERIRTYLRLEQLFDRLRTQHERESALDHHFALVTLFETLEVAARSDLKTDIVRDLEKQKAKMAAFRGNPGISEGLLDELLGHLGKAAETLVQQQGKPGHDLNENDWLMSVRSRMAIPGGTCTFDLPSYHRWQQYPAKFRQNELSRWCASLGPTSQAIQLLLKILRDSGQAKMMVAAAGQFQMGLPQGRKIQLLRLRLDPALDLVPEISGNRLIVSVRMLRQDDAGKFHTEPSDTPFELALCA